MSTTAVRTSEQPHPAAADQGTRPRAQHRTPRPELTSAPAPAARPAPDPTGTPAPARHAVLALPAEVRWVPVARRGTAAVLTHWRVPAADVASAELVVDELAANAAEHGHRDMTVRLSLDAEVLRITVTDSGGRARNRRPSDTDPDEHGRGLSIVGLLTREVRVRRGPRGRRVSVVLRTAGVAGDGASEPGRQAEPGPRAAA